MLKLNEDLFDNQEIPAVETEVVTDTDIMPEGPEQGADTGIANIIHDLIIDENEAIQGYNNIIANLETRPELIPIMQDIANEEMNHIGMLEVALEMLSPNVEGIKEGEAEAEETLDTIKTPVNTEESDNIETDIKEESLTESINISDDLVVLRTIDQALANNPVSEKLTEEELESLADTINEFLHRISEKKSRVKRK